MSVSPWNSSKDHCQETDYGNKAFSNFSWSFLLSVLNTTFITRRRSLASYLSAIDDIIVSAANYPYFCCKYSRWNWKAVKRFSKMEQTNFNWKQFMTQKFNSMYFPHERRNGVSETITKGAHNFNKLYETFRQYIPTKRCA